MPKLLEQVQNLLRTRHYSYRTEQTYLHWIQASYILCSLGVVFVS
jgi:hypothetical protein